MFFSRIAELMGITDGQARVFVLVFAVVAAAAFYLAADGAGAIYERYSGGGGSAASEIEARAKRRVWVAQGDTLPDVADVPDGALCGANLSGERGLEYGWVWERETGGCRRIAARLHGLYLKTEAEWNRR